MESSICVSMFLIQFLVVTSGWVVFKRFVKICQRFHVPILDCFADTIFVFFTGAIMQVP